MKRFWPLLAPAGVVAVLLAGCGGSPTGQGAGRAGTEGGTHGLDAVLADVKDLEGRERTDRLAELARDAGGTVGFYTALTTEQADAVREAFAEEYGVTLKVYRASGETLVQRLLQEAEAGSPGADLVETGGTEMVTLTDEGVLAEYESPHRADLIDEALIGRTWTGTRMQVFAPAWNTRSTKEPPSSWEDLADPRWDGRLAMEIGNSDWYMALSEYWRKAGKSSEEIERLWREIATGTTMVDGHSTMRELMVSGEFDASATLYSYMTEESVAKGAPLAWEPAVSPLIVRTQGAGITRDAPNPAGAALLMDWLLSAEGGQKVFTDAGIDSVRRDLWTLDTADTYPVDVVRYAKDLKRWQDEFERVTRLGEKAEGS